MEGSSYQQHLDALTAWASREERKPDLLVAKADYFKHTGEVFEDDRTFEMRMAAYLDYFLFDRVCPDKGKTPAQEYLEEKLRENPTEAEAFRGFTQTVHGLFEVRKLGKGLVRMRELFSAQEHEVTERRALPGLLKGDILEARLIPFAGLLLFSSAFTFHPREATKAILKEVKRVKKNDPQRAERDLVWDCARRALKVDRYRQIAVEKIYDFETNPI